MAAASLILREGLGLGFFLFDKIGRAVFSTVLLKRLEALFWAEYEAAPPPLLFLLVKNGTFLEPLAFDEALSDFEESDRSETLTELSLL